MKALQIGHHDTDTVQPRTTKWQIGSLKCPKMELDLRCVVCVCVFLFVFVCLFVCLFV
jgi:hypothetical protein